MRRTVWIRGIGEVLAETFDAIEYLRIALEYADEIGRGFILRTIERLIMSDRGKA